MCAQLEVPCWITCQSTRPPKAAGHFYVRLHMPPQVWRDVEELLRYLAANWPFDPENPFESKVIPVDARAGGDTPLHFAASWDDVRGIELLVDAGADVDNAGDMSCTPLATAVARGNVAAVRALLRFGASPRAISEFGITPYDIAMLNGSEEMKREFGEGSI